MHRGRALLAGGQAAQAVPRLQEAMRGMSESNTGFGLGRRGHCALELARALDAMGDGTSARSCLLQAETDLQQRLREAPEDTAAAARLAEVHRLMAAAPAA
jgi:predicted Zn-dependent protease